MMNQRFAGYILPGVRKALKSRPETTFMADGVLRSFCAFDIVSDVALDAKHSKDLPLIAAASNIVSRGLPTFTSTSLSDEFRKRYAFLPDSFDDSAVSFPEELVEPIRAIAVPFDPRISVQQAIARLRDPGVSRLLTPLLPALQQTLGLAAVQLLEKQGDALLLPFPAPSGAVRGLRFVSAEGFEKSSGKPETGWLSVPIAGDAAVVKQRLSSLLKEHAAELHPLRNASKRSPFASPQSVAALELLFSPMAVARIQSVLLECMLSGVLVLSADEWKITVLERDVPCARLAVRDLTRLLYALFQLEGASRTLPPIALTVLTTQEFAGASLHASDEAAPVVFSQSAEYPATGVFIDIAMLRLGDMDEHPVTIPAAAAFTIRSSRTAQRERRFHLTGGLRYTGLSRGREHAWELVPETESAVRALLRDLFRIAEPRPGQMEMIDRLLRGEHLIAAMPPAAGKTLPILFSAMLQSAATLCIGPTSALLADQARILEAAGIDACVLLQEAQHREERLTLLHAFSSGQAIIAFLPSDLFVEEDTRTALGDLRKNGIVCARGVIDEADCGSEWGHDARFSMRHLPARLCGIVSAAPWKLLPIAALTASMSPRVHAHIRTQMRSADCASLEDRPWLLLSPGVLPPACRLLPIVSGERESGATSDQIRALLSRVPSLLQRCQTTMRPDQRFNDLELRGLFQNNRNDAVVVFCADATGQDGVSIRYGQAGIKGLAESLDHAPFRTSRFAGNDTEGVAVGRQILRDSALQYARFALGEANLMVATRAYGIGTNRSGIRATIHVRPPASIVRLLQECGRAGHDGYAAVCAVRLPEDFRQGKRGETSDGMRAELRRGLSSAAREKQIIHGLLREISYSEDTNTSRIANMIGDEFGVSIIASYWQRNLDERLYVQTRKGEVLGYVDLVTLAIVVDAVYPDQAFAKEVLDFAFSESIAAAGSGPRLSTWVSTTFPSDLEDGIARQMKDFDPGATFTLRISFENDKEPLLTQIHSLLWRRADIQVQRKILSEITADSWESFCEQVEQRSRKSNIFDTLDPDLASAMRQIFLKIRGREDTERAILRLMALGAVTDCVSYPASRKFALTLGVLRDEEYIEHIQRYVRMLMPEKDAQRVLQMLPACAGNSVLEQCLNFLVDQLYRWLDDDQQRELADARALAMIGWEDDADERFHAFAEHTMVARYAREDELPPALLRGGDALMHSLLATVDSLEAEGSASVYERLGHLRRSCEVLENRFPRHPLLTALMCIADLLEMTDKEKAEAARRGFGDAVLHCLAEGSGDRAACETSIHRLGMILRRHLDDEVLSPLERSVTERLGSLSELRETLQREGAAAASADTPKQEAPQPRSVGGSAPTAISQYVVPDKAAQQVPRDSAAAHAQSSPKAQDQPDVNLPAFPSSSVAVTGTSVSLPDATDEEIEPLPQAETRNHAAEDRGAGGDVDAENVRESQSQGASAASAPAPANPETSPAIPARENQANKPASSKTSRATAPVKQPPTPHDPIIKTHLAWLQAFNQRFLKEYESRNPKLPSDA